ncbi:hypothetical protein HMPREF0201_01461 [Cedecea davisae DSM 4568]|uniref:Uncharacterized protein n=1 Tax=Cedecea davisae DSM 4568 TaxID=566551 RepID=S3JD10_9ENTR|nr:hypothetical protein HMPREF0201_01461 [Cedecea davisae DSM 4568]
MLTFLSVAPSKSVKPVGKFAVSPVLRSDDFLILNVTIQRFCEWLNGFDLTRLHKVAT